MNKMNQTTVLWGDNNRKEEVSRKPSYTDNINYMLLACSYNILFHEAG
jgi:hypothetical protein